MILRCILRKKIILLVALVSIFSPFANGLEVIVNKDSSIESIGHDYLKAIFTGRVKMWNDGTPIKVVLFSKSSQIHRKFCKDVLNSHPRQVSRLWDVVVFSGSGEKPIVVDNSTEMIEKIKQINGSIGYFEGDIKVNKEDFNVIHIE